MFAAVADEIAAEPAPVPSFAAAGAYASALGDAGANLVVRAARAFAAEFGPIPPLSLSLTKNLPVAAGIGGGSADAAATLRLLSRFAGFFPDPARLSVLARSLGADVPVCLAAQPARVSGIGEILTPAPALPRFGLVLANPGLQLATPTVFATWKGAFSASPTLPFSWSSAAEMAADLGRLGNDLEAPALALAPAIGTVLAALRALPGCLLARMSGSGATCFGLFANADEAAAGATALARSGWWVWSGPLAGSFDGKPSGGLTSKDWGVAKR